MSTTSIILWSAGGVFVIICLLLALFIGFRVAGRRHLTNAAMRSAHHQSGKEFREIGFWRWIWMNVRVFPTVLILCIVSVIYLMVGSIWCLVVRRPKPPPTSARPDNEKTA